MFGLGFFEIILILAGILVFIRPQDLPAFVYRVGKVYGQFKEMYTKFWREANILKNQIDDMVEKETKGITEISKEDNSLEDKMGETITSHTKPFHKEQGNLEGETLGQKNPFSLSGSKTTLLKKGTKKRATKSKPTPVWKGQPVTNTDKTVEKKVEKTNKASKTKLVIAKNSKIKKTDKKTSKK